MSEKVKQDEKQIKIPSTPSFVVELEVQTNAKQNKQCFAFLEDARKIQNTVAGIIQKRIRHMWKDPLYKKASQMNQEGKELAKSKKKEEKEKGKRWKEEAKTIFQELHKTYRLSQSECEKDGKEIRAYFHNRLDSVATQKACNRAWVSVKEYLYRKSKQIHFLKYGENASIEGKSNVASLRVLPNEKGLLRFFYGDLGLELKQTKKKDMYMQETISHLLHYFKNPNEIDEYNQSLQQKFLNRKISELQYKQSWKSTYRIKYNRLVMKEIRGRKRFFVQMVVEGYPVPKRKKDGSFRHVLGLGNVGNDFGTQTVAVSAEEKVGLYNLADKTDKQDRSIVKLQRKMNRQRRANNPDNYHPNGTMKRGKKTWQYSKRYLKNKQKLKEFHRKNKIKRLLAHRTLINQMISLGDAFYGEKMAWKGLQKRKKETEINEKGKYVSKKRFGRTIGNKAPSLFISLYKQKVESLGGTFEFVNTTTYKASQYDHTTEKARKKHLSERWTILSDGTKVQRDLYSSFLLQYPKQDKKKADFVVCRNQFHSFFEKHENCIQEIIINKKIIKNSGIKIPK